ncbi:hypothetical protein G7070_01110 [Propioniciclava coleopterorum]|uniref:Multicomponent Na+:H+ antiporter subunit F n=1 Tax=Propioniciclava coleopterorum TaxID=2714937 RepID=A0A6G7Y3E1_9ACTN|nr:monovalent cation/H+ antiporter complex subunit F [Propioniciclava coleopterorum]QIK71141.1 hypothetical protein G7070_01110 [Propioniciclava coleopterorum]
MTISQVILMVAAVILLISALLAFYRLTKGPTGLDRGVASDVLLAILIAAICAHALWYRTSIALVIILVLSLVGFTTAVGLARLITGTSARERMFLEAEARAAYEERRQAEAEAHRIERERSGADPRDGGDHAG